MMTVLGCIVQQHNIWLVLLAVLICATGAWVTARLFLRSHHTRGMQKMGWQFLTSMSAAAVIWCTHFIAVLGYEPGVPVTFAPQLTMVSLLIALIGSMAGFVVASCGWRRYGPPLGGAVLGLAIVLMHYTGMLAYRVQGIVTWKMPYLIASVVLSVALSSLALVVASRRAGSPRSANLMAALFTLAIASLHFIGMTAFQVEPLAVGGGDLVDPIAVHALAIAISVMALVIVGTGLVSYLIDGSVRSESIERLRRMALSDPLTGLPNRTSFSERLERELADLDGAKLALIGIDLNRFKEINDLRGHHAGDEVLRILARRMNQLLREHEFVARIGGDEFAAVIRYTSRSALVDFLSRLEAALCKRIHYDDWEVVPGASLGVAIYPDDAANQTQLINNADLAMYRAKADPVRSICFYERAMDETVRVRRTLSADLRGALSQGQLSVYYQAQNSLTTGEIIGYEALLRWQHPKQGFIPPSEFIPLAEENGLILQIGEWVLHEACTQAVTWKEPYKVAVNLSPVQFAHTDLPGIVARVLQRTGLAPERLELELTESTIFANRERSLQVLREIKALGVHIALDDFGTGYSSLDTLRTFPFDKIKLDRSFFGELAASPQATAIVRAVLALGKSLGIPVLAEGIETLDQLSLLTDEGCDEAQGYWFGRPAPLSQLVASGQVALRDYATE